MVPKNLVSKHCPRQEEIQSAMMYFFIMCLFMSVCFLQVDVFLHLPIKTIDQEEPKCRSKLPVQLSVMHGQGSRAGVPSQGNCGQPGQGEEGVAAGVGPGGSEVQLGAMVKTRNGISQTALPAFSESPLNCSIKIWGSCFFLSTFTFSIRSAIMVYQCSGSSNIHSNTEKGNKDDVLER